MRRAIRTQYQTGGLGFVTPPAPWGHLAVARHNVLIEGPRQAVDSALGLVERSLSGVVVRRHPEEPLDLTLCQFDRGRNRTLILEDVTGLTPDEQARLRQWMDDFGLPRIISTSSARVFALVERGLFDPALYYRLNVLLVRVGSVDWPAPHEAKASYSVSAAPGPGRKE